MIASVHIYKINEFSLTISSRPRDDQVVPLLISNVLAFVHNKLWNPPIRLHIGHCSVRSPQFLVDQGHNIFEVTESLFAGSIRHSAL